MKIEPLNPRFRYGQKVRVVSGFHRTRKGTVIRFHTNRDGDVISYDIRFGWSWFGLNEFYETIPFSDLEAL